MLKAEVVLNVISSETKFYLMHKSLTTYVVSAVYKKKLRPSFIGPFTVIAKKGLAYTLSLQRNCAHTLCCYLDYLSHIGIGPM